MNSLVFHRLNHYNQKQQKGMGSGGSKTKPVPTKTNTGEQPIPQKPISRPSSTTVIDNQTTKTPEFVSEKGSPAPSRASVRTHASTRSKSSTKSNRQNGNDIGENVFLKF